MATAYFGFLHVMKKIKFYLLFSRKFEAHEKTSPSYSQDSTVKYLLQNVFYKQQVGIFSTIFV